MAYLSGSLEESSRKLRPSMARRQLRGSIKAQEQRHGRTGIKMVKVPYTAAKTLAEGEFNRFYIRAVCRHVLESGGAEVEIYRAKRVEQPRPDLWGAFGTDRPPRSCSTCCGKAPMSITRCTCHRGRIPASVCGC